MLKKIQLYITLLVAGYCFGNPVNTDSLKTALSKQTKHDTIRLKTLNNLGLKLKANEPHAAINYLFEAEQLALKLKNEDQLTRTYNVLGICYKSLGRLDSALFYYKKGLDLALKIGDSTSCGYLYSNMGNVYKNRGMYEKAVENFLHAADIHQRMKNTGGLSSTYNNIGLVYDDMNKNDKAMEYYELSLKLAVSESDSESISRSYSNMSIVLDKMGESKKGLEYRLKAMEIDRRLGNKHSLSITLVNLGAYYSDNGNFKEALNYYNQALLLKEEIEDKKGIANVMNNIGNAYIELGERQKALGCLLKALQLSKDNFYIEIEADACKHLSDFYKGNNFELAYTYYVRHKQLEDSIYNTESNKLITEMQTKYETDKKEQEIALLNKYKAIQNADLEKQKSIRNYFIAFGGLVLILAVVLLVAFKYKQKANTLLSKQKSEIVAQRDEIEKQKHVVEEKNKEITDSIHYARRIQRALLTSNSYIRKYVPEFFILYKPKDIVSGDFYWAASVKDCFLLATCDCTGHGVPGAFMSLLNISLLNEVTIERGITQPDLVLNEIREDIIKALNAEEEEEENIGTRKTDVNDGMDCSLLKIDFKNSEIEYAAANNPFYIVRNGNLIVCDADKMPVSRAGKKH